MTQAQPKTQRVHEAAGPLTPPPAPAAPTWRSRSAWAVLVVVTILGLAFDLWSKHAAFQAIRSEPTIVDRAEVLRIAEYDPRGISALIPRHEAVKVIPGVLDFTLVLNPGAVFGIGPGKRWFFIGFTAVAMGFAMVMFAHWTRPRDRWAHAAIGLLVAGGLGNFYDRLAYGCVRDFIHPLPGVKFPGGWDPWGSGGQVWPYVSNVADLWLIIGIAVLAVHLWKRDGHAHKPAEASPSPTAGS